MASVSEKIENFISKYTPAPIKRAVNWLIDLLPEKWGNWIRSNKFLSLCIVYSIRGLFFRPSMWAVYAGIGAYIGLQ